MSSNAVSPDATTTSTPAAPWKSPRDGKANFATGKQAVQPSGSTPVNQHNIITQSSVRLSPGVNPIRQRQPTHILPYGDDAVHENVSSYSGELLALITTILASADLPASIPVYSDCMSATHTALAAQREQGRPPITRRYGANASSIKRPQSDPVHAASNRLAPYPEGPTPVPSNLLSA